MSIISRKYLCATTQEVAYSYKDYLKTKWWEAVKYQYRLNHGYKCYVCGATENIDLHHRTYQTIGNETSKDLVQLCRECHYKVHDIVDSGGKFVDICFAVEKLKYLLKPKRKPRRRKA